MAAPTPPRPPLPSGGMIPPEWPAQAADTIVDTIAKVRDKTTKPAIVATRAAVYGLVAGILGIVAFILLLVGIIHLFDNFFPGEIWIIYGIFFILFSGIGLFLLRKANAPTINPEP